MPPSSKPPPLPLAPDRAAISNQISLLLSSRTSLLKTLNPASSSATPTTTTTRRHQQVSSDDIEQLFSGPRPNEGVGYVPDSKTASKDAASREDRMLRGRLLGKKQKGGKGNSKFAVESESDEEPGRSGLGKRKRPRREPIVVEEEEEKEEDRAEDEKKVEDAETGDAKGESAAPVQDHNGASGDGDDGGNNKKNKKKKKRQRQKQKQKQGNSSS